MPSTVLTARLILVVVVSLVYCGNSQILGSDDDLFTYYASADSPDSHQSAQAQKQLFSSSPDTSNSLNLKQSRSDSGEESQQNADTSLRNSEPSYSKLHNPLSSLLDNSLSSPYLKGSGSLSDDEEKGYSVDEKMGMEMLPRIGGGILGGLPDKRSDPGERLKLLQQTARNRYLRLQSSSPWETRELKRERTGSGGGATLSVESSLDLIRQRFLQELRRRKQLAKQKQIESNDEILSSIGKRSGGSSSRANGRGTSQMH